MGRTAENQRYYQKTKEYHKQRRARQQQSIRDFVKEIKQGLACIMCGEAHPACISFHHRNPAEKSFNIANAVHHGYSKQHILDEVAKCDVLCENCHRKLHWRVE